NKEFTRVSVDIADYKKQRADRLAEKVEGWVAKVKSSGEDYTLKPMNSADRRIVHKVADEAGLRTESVGEGRDRHVVIKPSEEAASD
ncbi:single-stranded DNA-binding protein, partial [Candidatus Saccharibacteria bacterium]|nr:single-stranded DNA-binding protein [Candidatus Saccharibacteria bacterium]